MVFPRNLLMKQIQIQDFKTISFIWALILLSSGLRRPDLCILDSKVKASVLNSDLLFQELGLVAGTPVGTSLIDAHAGGVGIMESVPELGSEAKGIDDI